MYSETCVCLNFSTTISDSLNHILTCWWFLFINFIFEIALQKEIWRTTIWQANLPNQLYRSSDHWNHDNVLHDQMLSWNNVLDNHHVETTCSVALLSSSNVGSSFSKMSRYISPFKLTSIMWRLIFDYLQWKRGIFTAELYA